MELSDEEEKKISEWLVQHVTDKTKYNYGDLYYCVMPALFVKDVDCEAAKSLFCSQACVLALRYGVTSKEDMKEALLKINSRVCTPNAFYKFIKPFCVAEI